MGSLPASVASASKIQMDYMKLLVTQLQNQNPLEPMDNSEMASQLAQMSQLQQLESLKSNSDDLNSLISSSFADILDSENRSYAQSLVGKDVSFIAKNSAGEFMEMEGSVESVVNDPEDGNILVFVENGESRYAVPLDGIVSVNS